MPRGFHYSRNRTRAYTSEYHRINAKLFKPLLISKLGGYTINNDVLSLEHKKLQLSESESGIRIATFTINDKPHQIALKLDNRSASNKLYITCPYCQKQRQHLYAVKFAYACRECLKLHYATQAERPRDRLMRKIRKKRISIWGANWPEVRNMFAHPCYWTKPKSLHWKTFWKARDELYQLERQYWPMVELHFQSQFGHLKEYSKK
jgi:hypothetical protein